MLKATIISIIYGGSEIDDFDKFTSELGKTLHFISKSDSNNEMKELLKNDSMYSKLGLIAASILEKTTGIRIPEAAKKGEIVDMCKAWEEYGKECNEQGLEKGFAEYKDVSEDEVRKYYNS